MKRKHLYISVIAASLLTACSTESALDPEMQPEANAFLPVNLASQPATGGYVPFDDGDKIRLYFAYDNLSSVPWWHQGIYTFPAEGTVDTQWDPTLAGENIDLKNTSIYQKHITKGNDGEQYYFTATSLPEPYVGTDSTRYQVLVDQNKDTANIKRSDFVIARGVYKNDNWKTNGLHLHFRHVLSQLVIKIILPEGSTNDGYFPNPKNISCTATIHDRQIDYKVTYNKEKGDGAILDINKETGNKLTASIDMYKSGEAKDTVTTNGGPAAYHTFRAILPNQTMQKSENNPLLSFVIDGKKYSYNPKELNTIELAQEKITTVILTVLSGAGASKIELNNVTIEDWITDKADVGELIPQQ